MLQLLNIAANLNQIIIFAKFLKPFITIFTRSKSI